MLREVHLKFTKELTDTLTIQNINSNGILINDKLWPNIIALTAQEIVEDWPKVEVSELTDVHFSTLIKYQPEIIIVGTGRENIFAPRELMFSFARRGIGLELMSTPAAARTFNVIASEGRPVAAVLYPIAQN
tara:strand:- start:1080 stop:1475 length:396 start_codon:yes stop_codon:yes gene_type:complete